MDDRLTAAIQLALKTAPYLRDVVAAARWVITDQLPMPTLASDKYWRVYVHPEALGQWSPAELAWGILHETGGHLLRGHCTAHDKYPGESPERLNLAQDLEIESWEWPGGPAKRPAGQHAGVHPADYNLPAGELWEWYLAHLPANPAPSRCECGSAAHGQARDWELGADNAPVKPGGVHERAIKQQAAARIQAAAGDAPAGLAVWADTELAPPPIDWRSVLRCDLSARVAAGCIDRIGAPRERRGLLVARWRAPRQSVAIIADTSGSMGGEGALVLGAVVDIARTVATVDVAWTDTEPHWQTGVRSAAGLRPAGGGGTDLTPAIEEAQERQYDHIIIITDCELDWPAACSRSIVLATNGGQPPKNWRSISCQSM